MEKFLQLVEFETEGKCYKSYRYCADEELRVPTLSYEDSQSFTICKDKYGETDTTLKNTKDLKVLAKKLSTYIPLFHFSLRLVIHGF
jgi:hypothetical protein